MTLCGNVCWSFDDSLCCVCVCDHFVLSFNKHIKYLNMVHCVTIKHIYMNSSSLSARIYVVHF